MTAGSDHVVFLGDGPGGRPSPVLLVVGDSDQGAAVAGEVHAGRTPWPAGPAGRGRLLEIDVAGTARQADGRMEAFFATLAATNHWLFLPGLERLADGEGLAFVDSLIPAIGHREVAAVIVTVTAEGLAGFRRAAPRLAGWATTLDGDTAS